MDSDELADALAAQQQGPQASQNGASWDGRIAVNPRTGHRLVYRISPTGRGHFVALSADTAAPAARDRVDALTNRMAAGERTLEHARQFIDLNATAQTGGPQNEIVNDEHSMLGFTRQFFPNAQRFQSLSRQMAQDNWQPGTSGMMNTATEQNIATQRYPSGQYVGPVNRDIYLGIATDVGVQQHAVQDMREWLSTHPTLDGWDTHWHAIEDRLRPRLRADAERQFNENLRTQQAPRSGWGAAPPPPPPASAPASGGATRLRFNPQTGQLEPAR